VISETDMIDAIIGMTTLNKAAAEAMRQVDTHACTDITGFGLLGHTVEMAEASQIGIIIDSTALPIYPQVFEMAAIGLVPAGSYRNREHYLPSVVNRDRIAQEIIDIIADPQTSGGLLIAVPGEQGQRLLAELAERKTEAFIVGRVVKESPGKVRID
jgi:selenide, water dikinase